ncbi:MAG: hypothetical protein KF821_00805 [Anaerolineales bacterium]|nr:hypothetical protein [Anaerolineales bacterium]
MKHTARLLYIVVALVLAGCSAGPASAAREWYKANLEMNGSAILARTCQAQQLAVQEAGLLVSAIMLMPQMLGIDLGMDDINSSLSNLKFHVVSSTDTQAIVQVTGELEFAVLAFAQQVPVSERALMVKEDGQWKWCGLP